MSLCNVSFFQQNRKCSRDLTKYIKHKISRKSLLFKVAVMHVKTHTNMRRLWKANAPK
jgi:hypothetical protein